MANFDLAFKRTSSFEGGYVNDPDDRGGETYNGISRVNNPKWKGWDIVDSYKRKPNFPSNMKADAQLKVLEKSLYKSVYWDGVWGDKIKKQNVANDLYDTAVNMGTATSIKLVQRQFGLRETGKMDEALLIKLNSIR